MPGQHYKTSLAARRLKRLLLPAVGILFISALLAACSPPSFLQGDTTPTPTLPTAPATPSPTPTLPPLAAENGWHTVLTLGYSGKGVDNIGGSFVATKSFTIFFSCEGSGLMTIAYSPVNQTVPTESQLVSCGASPQPGALEDLQPTSPGEGVQVTATTNGPVIWEALVEMQN